MWDAIHQLLSRFRPDSEWSTVVVNDTRVEIFDPREKQPHGFSWIDVEEICTYKLDLLTTDEICLAFRVGDGWHQVCESDDGFKSLVEKMQERFPAVPENWFLEVMQPPMATNQRTLWKRDT